MKQEAGLGLLELLLVIVIGMAIILLGLKQYESYRQYEQVNEVKQSVVSLLSQASDYYHSNCLTNMYAPAPPTDTLTATPTAPQLLTNLSPAFPNVWGNFDDGSSFKTYLNVQVQSNANQTWLWYVTTEACITRPDMVGTDPLLVKSLFSAADAKASQAGCSGILLTWQRLPRETASTIDSGLWLLSTGRDESNRQYQYGAWMQQSGSNITDKTVFNYLCQ